MSDAAPVQFSVTRLGPNLFRVIVQSDREILRSYEMHSLVAVKDISHELAELVPVSPPKYRESDILSGAGAGRVIYAAPDRDPA